MTRNFQRSGVFVAAVLFSAVNFCGWNWGPTDYGVTRIRTRTTRSVRLDDTDPAHEYRAGLKTFDPKPSVQLGIDTDPPNDDAVRTTATDSCVIPDSHSRLKGRRNAFQFSARELPLPADRNYSLPSRAPPTLS